MPIADGGLDGAPLYDETLFQTVLADATADWNHVDLAGRLAHRNAGASGGDPRWVYIVSNTETAIRVWGDVSDFVSSGDVYKIYDLHLESGSPCINTGDNSSLPEDALDLDDDGDTTEPTPTDRNGDTRQVGTVDMGAFEAQQ